MEWGKVLPYSENRLQHLSMQDFPHQNGRLWCPFAPLVWHGFANGVIAKKPPIEFSASVIKFGNNTEVNEGLGKDQSGNLEGN